MDIEIKDYLNPDEIKEICKDALYQKIREDMRGLNINDIIANIPNADVEPNDFCSYGEMRNHNCPNCGADMLNRG